jgi:hypothetical protein
LCEWFVLIFDHSPTLKMIMIFILCILPLLSQTSFHSLWCTLAIYPYQRRWVYDVEFFAANGKLTDSNVVSPPTYTTGKYSLVHCLSCIFAWDFEWTTDFGRAFALVWTRWAFQTPTSRPRRRRRRWIYKVDLPVDVSRPIMPRWTIRSWRG